MEKFAPLNYNNRSLSGSSFQWKVQYLLTALSVFCIGCLFYNNYRNVASSRVATPLVAAPTVPNGNKPFTINGTSGSQSSASISTLVADALAFNALLTTTQQASLNQSYTTTLARKWSNLPCGSSCRNGLQIGALTGTTYAAAMQVIRDAMGIAANNGYNEYYQTCLAEAYLHINGGASGYDSTLRWMCFLNTPSTTGAWMLQVGGHHYAANIAFNNGHVIGATPFFMGLEPKSFTYNGKSYAPLNDEHDAFANMLAGLSSAQLTTAKLTQSFSDCYLIPGESNGGRSAFPATKVGIQCSNLTTAQKNLVLDVISKYTSDMDSATAATQQQVYANEINDTYIAFVGAGTAGSASTFLTAQGNYARIDGPHVWIEMSCQGGIVIQGQIHYHTVWRDHVHDYGVDLTGTSIDEGVVTPLKLVSFSAVNDGKTPLVKWTTVNEINVDRFEIEQSTDAAKPFSHIGTVRARNLLSQNQYSLNVPTPLPAAVTYYRLKMIDADGKTTYSNVVSIRSGNNGKLSLVNSIVTNNLLVVNQQANILCNYRILDLSGQVLTAGKLQSATTSIALNKLPAGPYILVAEDGSEKLSARFVKQ